MENLNVWIFGEFIEGDSYYHQTNQETREFLATQVNIPNSSGAVYSGNLTDIDSTKTHQFINTDLEVFHIQAST